MSYVKDHSWCKTVRNHFTFQVLLLSAHFLKLIKKDMTQNILSEIVTVAAKQVSIPFSKKVNFGYRYFTIQLNLIFEAKSFSALFLQTLVLRFCNTYKNHKWQKISLLL